MPSTESRGRYLNPQSLASTSLPTWNPATGEIAYVRRRSPEAEAEVVAVDPRAPGGERPLTTPGRSYTSPAFSPSGTLLALIADGMSNNEICVELDVTVETVKTHVSRILAKLDVRSRTEAAAVAHRVGLDGDAAAARPA